MRGAQAGTSNPPVIYRVPGTGDKHPPAHPAWLPPPPPQNIGVLWLVPPPAPLARGVGTTVCVPRDQDVLGVPGQVQGRSL